MPPGAMDDPFEAFRKKKESAQAAQKSQEAAAKVMLPEPEEAGRPKGFRRGRLRKPDKPAEAVPPKGLKVFEGAKGEIDLAALHKPKGYTLNRAEETPVDPAQIVRPAKLTTDRYEPAAPLNPEEIPHPAGFSSGRHESHDIDPKAVVKPKGLKRF